VRGWRDGQGHRQERGAITSAASGASGANDSDDATSVRAGLTDRLRLPD
jgi:hypothetical protein